MNSNLIPPEEKEAKLPIDFRIIGRDSWKDNQERKKTNGNVEETTASTNSSSDKFKKPSMSWSVPFRWFWVMPSRIRTNLMTPMPLDGFPTAADVKAGKVEVLKGFQVGSK